MKQLARHLIRIYPAAWRVRYAEEMEALLEQMELSATDILDLLFGATQAHIDRLKEKLQLNPISRLSIVAVLIGLVLIGLALIPGGRISEDAGEFLLVIAIVMVLPAIGSLSAFYPADTPRANQITRRIGQLSGAVLAITLLISAAVGIFAGRQVSPNSVLTLVFMAGIAGLAVWFVLNGWLGLRGGIIPAGLAVIGMLFGPLLLAVFFAMGNFLPELLTPDALRSVMNIVTPLWLITFMVWLVWTAMWLWLRRRTATLPTDPLTRGDSCRPTTDQLTIDQRPKATPVAR